MRTTRSRLGLLIGVPVLLGLTVLLSSVPAEPQPKRGGTLRVSYGNEIAHLDFHTAPGYEMMWVENRGARSPRFSHRAWLRDDVGGDERRVRAREHHARRQVRARRRGVVADLLRQSALHLQAQEERPLPRWDQG